MKIKKIILGIVVSAALGGFSSWGYLHIFSIDSAVQAADTIKGNKVLTETEASTMIPFKYKKISVLPFKTINSYAQVSEIGSHKGLELTFTSQQGEYVTLRVTDAKILPKSDKYTIEKGKDNAIDISYMDNMKAQFLYWQQDGLSYSIVASKGTDLLAFNKNDLVKMMKSLK